jgi:hypothetical protein
MAGVVTTIVSNDLIDDYASAVHWVVPDDPQSRMCDQYSRAQMEQRFRRVSVTSQPHISRCCCNGLYSPSALPSRTD